MAVIDNRPQIPDEPLQRDTPAPWIGPVVIATCVFGLILFAIVVLVVFP